MNAETLFVLAKEVEFVPVNDVSEQLKKGFTHNSDDVVITNTNSRHNSKLINKDLSALLQSFQTAQTLATAIFQYAAAHQKDAQQVADDVFETLMNMQQWGFLIPFTQDEMPLQQGLLKGRATFRGYTVLKKLRGYEDTEVYQLKDKDGKLFALKIMSASGNSHVEAMFFNELHILQRLDNVVNPTLTDHGKEDDFHFLIMEWCEGLIADTEMEKYRNTNTRDNIIKLVDRCIAILNAFYKLHKQGVIHGDVNPENIIIDRSGHVKIIDYGYAFIAGNTTAMMRGGVGMYYEPEFATAFINNSTRPPVTEKADQYSIAALLYKLITGQPYLDFSLEQQEFYRQIMSDEPLPLSNFDMQLPDELNGILAKALSKDPEKRYVSLSYFVHAMQQMRDTIFADNHFFVGNSENSEEQFTEFLIHKFGWDSTLIQQGLSMAPTCSVNLGAAGIAYMFYRMAVIKQDPDLMNLADIWINRAAAYRKDPGKSFYLERIGITKTTVGDRSIYHSETGIYLTMALISHARADHHAFSKSLEAFIMHAKQPCEQVDLVLGKAGILLGCGMLYRELKTAAGYQTETVERLADSLLQEIWTVLDKYPSMDKSNSVGYFGIAHGWSGLLYATLFCCNITGQGLPFNFANRVNQLLDCAIKKDNGICWPLSTGVQHSWPGWCNGSAGHIFLWVLLYKYFKDDKYLSIAEQLSNELFLQAPGHNGNLCCGTAGNAYAMLSLYNVTGDKRYLIEVQRLKQVILKNISSPLLYNNSLYKGEVGLGILFCESAIPGLARMPLFE